MHLGPTINPRLIVTSPWSFPISNISTANYNFSCKPTETPAMVLDDASPQAGSYSPDNATSNGPSTGPSTQNPALARRSPLKAKPELLVKPDLFTMYFGFYGPTNWKRSVARAMTQRVQEVWALTARNVTQEEFDAFTTHISRGLYYSKMGVPISSFLGGAYLYNRARKEYAAPGEAVSPRQLLDALRAQAAVDKTAFRGMIAKSAFKMLLFTMTGGIISSFAGIYATTAGAYQDPRLQQFLREMKDQRLEDIHKRKLEAQRARSRRLRGEGGAELDRQFKEELNGGGGYDKGGDYDPYSYDSSASAGASTQSYGDSSRPTQQYGTQQYGTADQTRSAPATSRRPQMYGGSPAPQGMGQEQPTSGTDFFLGGGDDDASPTAPEYRHTNIDGTPAGSAWERIRRQSGVQTSQQGSGGSPRMQRWNQPPQSSSQSSNNSPSDDQYLGAGKERAQADFDRLLEAERNASMDGPSSGRGWGS